MLCTCRPTSRKRTPALLLTYPQQSQSFSPHTGAPSPPAGPPPHHHSERLPKTPLSLGTSQSVCTMAHPSSLCVALEKSRVQHTPPLRANNLKCQIPILREPQRGHTSPETTQREKPSHLAACPPPVPSICKFKMCHLRQVKKTWLRITLAGP